MVPYLQDTDIIRCMKIREVQAETETSQASKEQKKRRRFLEGGGAVALLGLAIFVS